jgi:putative transposase
VHLVERAFYEKRDTEVAKALFAQAHEVVQQAPQRVAIGGHVSYVRAIEEELGEGVEHEVRCRGDPIEQSHRGGKQRYYPIHLNGTEIE